MIVFKAIQQGMFYEANMVHASTLPTFKLNSWSGFSIVTEANVQF